MRKKEIPKILQELQLEHGDYNTIAKMAETTSNYVAQVLNGERSADSKTGKRIMDAAKSLSQTKVNLISLANKNGADFSFEKMYMIPVTKPITIIKA